MAIGSIVVNDNGLSIAVITLENIGIIRGYSVEII